MDVLKINHSFIVIIAMLAAAAVADAGKLGAIRNAAQGNAGSANSASSRSAGNTSKASHSTNSEDSSDQEEKRKRRAPTRRNRRRVVATQPPTGGKLDRIRTSATSSRHAKFASHPTRSHRAHPHRRDHHPRGGVSFYANYASPVCLPTVVEEHHYYDVPPVTIIDPILPDAPIEAYSEPLMETPAVTPAVEQVQESIVLNDNPFEVLEPYQIRFEIDYAGDEGDVSRSGFGLLVNATGGLGVDTGVRMFRESGTDFRDHLWIGDLNITYELFPTNFMRTRAGVGLNWLSDSYGGEAGMNLTLGTELFAGRAIFSGELDLGTLGSADLLHGRLTASWRHSEHMEWFAGYDYLDIGGTEIRGVVGGLRFRF